MNVDLNTVLTEETNRILDKLGLSSSIAELYSNGNPKDKKLYFWRIDGKEPDDVDNSFDTPIEAIASLIAYLESKLVFDDE
ncbi:hypothetical protein [Microcoleus sp. herbarium14]|uniref:hypothetical protein n=1 Tax=Microcoleus sp. herbarium14 TaxID=3055439 RepID=UPI002FD4FAD9